jgi:hypothetical protein
MAVERVRDVRDGEASSFVMAGSGLCRTMIDRWLALASKSDVDCRLCASCRRPDGLVV